MINSTQAAVAVVGIPAHVITRSFDDHQLALLLGIFPVAAGAAALFSGTISDLLGRRTTLISGLLLLSITLVLHLFAKDFQTLFSLRGLSGLATGALTGLPSILLSDSIPLHKQIPATGKTLSGHALGQTLGIPFGITLLEVVSFPTLCFVLGIVTLLLTLFLRVHLPSRNPSKYYRSGELSAYLKESLTTLRDHNFASLALCSYISFTALSLFYISFTLWLLETVQIRPREIAPMHLLGGFLQVFVLLFVIHKTRVITPRQTVATSFALNALVFAGAYLTLRDLTSATLILALTLGIVAIRIPSFQYLVNNLGNQHQKGLRMSIVQTCNHLGKASGYITASYLSNHMEVHQIVLLCGILSVLGCLIFYVPALSRKFLLPLKTNAPRDTDQAIGESSNSNEKARLWHVRC